LLRGDPDPWRLRFHQRLPGGKAVSRRSGVPDLRWDERGAENPDRARTGSRALAVISHTGTVGRPAPPCQAAMPGVRWCTVHREHNTNNPGRDQMPITRRHVLAGSAAGAASLATGLARPAIAASEPIRIGFLPALTGPS